jgi:hypothetical protein
MPGSVVSLVIVVSRAIGPERVSAFSHQQDGGARPAERRRLRAVRLRRDPVAAGSVLPVGFDGQLQGQARLARAAFPVTSATSACRSETSHWHSAARSRRCWNGTTAASARKYVAGVSASARGSAKFSLPLSTQ